MHVGSLIRKGIKYIINSDYRFCIDAGRGKYNQLSDIEYLQGMFKARLGYPLYLDNPQTFNEKLQWLKIYDRRPEYSLMVDKYEAKEYITRILGLEYVIPTLGLWNHFDEIDFEQLPDRFVLKCTHDSGGLVIINDKHEFDKEKAKKKIEDCLQRNFFFYGREWPYKNVKPRIIAEQYIEDEANKGDLSDYKIHCFHGEPKVIQVITDRFSEDGMINDHYDLSWNKLDIIRGHYSAGNKTIPRPIEMDEMLELAKKLSAGIPYLRTDFYIVNHQIYFGELTFFPASGFRPFVPEKWDRIWGDWIKLPTDNVTE